MAEVQVQDKGNKGGKVRSKKQSTRVDMTPMVDLGFLLITFFMFTTTFTKPNIMNLGLPAKPKPGQEVPIPEIDLTNSITFIIAKDNKLFYHQKDAAGLNVETLVETTYDREGVEKVIAQAKSRAKKPDFFTVIIKPMEDASFRNFVDILDEMEITGSKRFSIGEIKPFEKDVYEQKVK